MFIYNNSDNTKSCYYRNCIINYIHNSRFVCPKQSNSVLQMWKMVKMVKTDVDRQFFTVIYFFLLLQLKIGYHMPFTDSILKLNYKMAISEIRVNIHI